MIEVSTPDILTPLGARRTSTGSPDANSQVFLGSAEVHCSQAIGRRETQHDIVLLSAGLVKMKYLALTVSL